MAIEFTVLGRPATAGSKRGIIVRRKDGSQFVAQKDDSGDRGTSWRGAVATAAAAAKLHAWLLDDDIFVGPILLHVVFYRARPKAHYRTGRNRHLLRDDAPEWPDTRPDIDKLTRALMDAMKGVVYADDAQVVVKHAEKRFGTPERAHVQIEQLEQAKAKEAA